MPQGRKGACDGAKASQHFSLCSCCQVSHQIIAVPCVAPAFFAQHHSCACCPLVLAHWLPTASRGPHSCSPSHASAFQHVTTCQACGSGALRRPVFSPLDFSVLPWRPIHPGQLEPTTLPLRRLAPVSCSVGLSPTLSLPISLALSCSLSPVAPLCSFPTVLYPLSLSFSLSLPLALGGGGGQPSTHPLNHECTPPPFAQSQAKCEADGSPWLNKPISPWPGNACLNDAHNTHTKHIFIKSLECSIVSVVMLNILFLNCGVPLRH